MRSELVMLPLQPIMFIQRQNNWSTILPHETKQTLPYIKYKQNLNLQATSNMPACYSRIYNFAESRWSRSWIFPWFV